MPIYQYRCPSCEWDEEIIKPMADSGRVETCRQCGMEMVKDLRANLPHAAPDSYHTPLHSDSLGIRSDQVAEHQRLYPDVPLDRDRRPVFTSYSQHQKYLDARGIVKQPALRQKQGKRIA
jgi:putative FmdB family regulatory protein